MAPTETGTLNVSRDGPIFVNEYEVYLRYGGPEEGGWHYEAGRFIDCLGASYSQDWAEDIRNLHAGRIAEENEGRYPLSSVLSNGRRVIHLEDSRGEDFPQETPRYC